MKKHTFVSDTTTRVLKALSYNLQFAPFSAFSAALRKKDVLINGCRIKDNVTVVPGDEITVFLPDNAEKNDYKIVYEDENVIFVDKGKGIEVCNGEYNLVNKLNEKGINVLPVHRLDRNTEGLVMLAKNQTVLDAFKKALGESRIKKYYTAEVFGHAKSSDVFTDYFIKNAQKSLVKVSSKPVPGSEKAITKYKLIKQTGSTAVLEVEISEGKTHQIRASLAYHGLPIIGDGKYGSEEINRKFHEKSQRLKAIKLVFDFENNSPLFYLNSLNVECR